MIVIKNLSYSIGERNIFNNFSLTINKGDRIGVIGTNGAGKSTLLNLITGSLKPDEGTIFISADERLGMLNQDFSCGADDTVYSFLEYDEGTFKALSEVGLSDVPLEASPLSFSGGQKTKLALAKVLLSHPTALLLDEPTNHLDDETLDWLRGYLKSFRGSVVMVSHDRHLLEATATQIIELDVANGRVESYAGGYNAYLEERAIRLDAWRRDYEEQEKERKRLEQWLAKKREQAAAHPNPATGRLIRSMEKRVERELVDRAIAKPLKSVVLKSAEASGSVHNAKRILKLDHVNVSFDSHAILQDVSLEIYGRARVRIAGHNGSGKTTLLKVILGELVADSGSVQPGENMHVGYFSQTHDTLDPNLTVSEEFMRTERMRRRPDNPRNVLGSFLFSRSDVDKYVRDLSPGERVRLMFAKLLQQQNDLLILDEPTNHLDIPSREVIEQSLIDFDGAIITVSHDRYFLERIGVDKTFRIDAGRLTEE